MKVHFRRLFLLALFAIVSIAGCKNNVVSTESPVSAVITGVVVGSNTTSPLIGVTVVLNHGGLRDSVVTDSSGLFQFIIDIPDTSRGVDVTITFRKTGYLTRTVSSTVKRDQSYPMGLDIDPSVYAIVTGVVRDSASAYPLGGADVIISLPANSAAGSLFADKTKGHLKSVSSLVVGSTTTLLDGSFAININLYDLDSINATMTISKSGFKSYKRTHAFTRGPNSFGTVPLVVDNGQSFVHVNGRVTDASSHLPIRNVSVVLSTSFGKDTVNTLSDGSYSFDVDLRGLSSISGTLLFSLTSYVSTTQDFSGKAGQTVTNDVALEPQVTTVGGDTATGRGVARSFHLVSVNPTEMSVHGVGGNETSVVEWQVLDSLGFPLDIGHRDTVVFEIPYSAQMGSAYVTPGFGVTDGSGKVSTTVNSGTVAGTLQLIARLSRDDGKVIESQPVLITVDGGLPDQAHFTFGVNADGGGMVNFAGYDWFGRTNSILAQAGDKYGNPVHQGTAVYFTSSWGGIATAAGKTNGVGQATATLLSGNPRPHVSGLPPALFGDASDSLLPILDASYGYPSDPTYFGGGTGYGWVKASTYGEDSVLVSDSTLVLFSAGIAPILLNYSASPLVGDTIRSGGNFVIPIHISDRFGNPLESGTTIKVTVKMPPVPDGINGSWSVDATGLPDKLKDNLTRGRGTTDFDLVLSGSMVNIAQACAFNVEIVVDGRNGKMTNTITGTLVP